MLRSRVKTRICRTIDPTGQIFYKPLIGAFIYDIQTEKKGDKKNYPIYVQTNITKFCWQREDEVKQSKNYWTSHMASSAEGNDRQKLGDTSVPSLPPPRVALLATSDHLYRATRPPPPSTTTTIRLETSIRGRRGGAGGRFGE